MELAQWSVVEKGIFDCIFWSGVSFDYLRFQSFDHFYFETLTLVMVKHFYTTALATVALPGPLISNTSWSFLNLSVSWYVFIDTYNN